MAQINKPTDYFNTVLYTANNGTLNVTGVGFQPDWVWIKGRSYSVQSNMYDVVRGVQKDLLSGSTNAETSSGELTSFDSDGFTVVDSATDRANYLTNTHVSWNWLAGGTGVSNTDGSITSTVSANTTSGFSIVSYTGNGSAGATIGHGLGVTPKFIIVKGRDTASNWQVGHSSLGWTQSIRLNQTGASASRTVSWNDTDPTSSVFSVGTDSDCNTNTNDYIAYCFAEKKGFSKFGSYTGNGNADGTFIYTGFKPAFLLTKKSSASGDSWNLLDATRNPNNAVDKRLTPDTSDAEATTTQYDFLSNGFKVRASTGAVNTSGATYIYMCFASEPLTGTNGVPCTAR